MIEWKVTIDTDNMIDFVCKHPEISEAILHIIHCEGVVGQTWEMVSGEVAE